LCSLAVMTVFLPLPFAHAAENQSSAKLEKLTLLLDWFVNPDHAPLIVAKEKGFFAEEGLDIRLEAPADPNDPPKLVAAEKADLAISYQPDLHFQAEQKLPLMRLGTLIATPLNTLIVLEDSPIKTLSDLKGKKIGHSVGGFEDALLTALLKEGGLSVEDVERINVNFALSPSLLSGQVDAIIGGYRNFELNQLDIEGRPGRAFYVEAHGVPSYDELIIIAHKDAYQDPVKKDHFMRFLSALEKATQYLINHPDESWKLFLKAHPDLDNELNKRAWRDTLPRFALRPIAHDQNRYKRFAAFLKDSGLITTLPPVETYAPMITD